MSGASPERFTFLVNGIEHTLEADGKTRLLDTLRNTLGLKGTRFGCGNEECGACFVLVDGHAVPACLALVPARGSRPIICVPNIPAE